MKTREEMNRKAAIAEEQPEKVNASLDDGSECERKISEVENEIKDSCRTGKARMDAWDPVF